MPTYCPFQPENNVCVQERCQIWDERYKRCVIHSIAVALQDLYDPFYEFAAAAKAKKGKAS
jgi:hypothetical protein